MKWVFLSIASAVSVASPILEVFAQSRIEELEATLAKSRELLEKVQRGAAPCHRDECQVKKGQILSSLFNTYESLPQKYSQFIPSLESGLSSAHYMVQFPFTQMPMEFPKTLSDWSGWWARRYEYEIQFRAQWLEFLNDTTRLYRAVDLWGKTFTRSPREKKLIQEAWDRGMGEIAELTLAYQSLAWQASALERTGQKIEAARLSEQARSLRLRSEELESQFAGSFRNVISALFPAGDFKSTLTSLSLWKRILDLNQSPDVLGDLTKQRVAYLRTTLKKISGAQNDFNDLEYGVIGLNNYYSSVNPEIMLDFEALIQDYLNLVDMGGRAIANTIGFFVMGEVTNAMFASKLMRYAIPTAASAYSTHQDFDPTTMIWEKSDISRQIDSALPRWRDEMALRLQNLHRAHKGLIEKIQELEAELNQLKNEETL